MDKKVNILIGLTTVSLIFNLYAVRALEKRSHQIADLQNRVEQVISSVNSSVSSLSAQVQNLRLGSEWLLNDRFLPMQAGSSREQVKLHYEATLREVGSSSRLYLQYREQGATEWTRSPATRAGGTVSANLAVATDKQWEYQLVEEGSTVRSGAVSSLPYNYYDASLRFRGISGGSFTRGDPAGDHLKQMTMEFWQGPTSFEFQQVKSARAELRRNGELVKTVPLTNADPRESAAKPADRIRYETTVPGQIGQATTVEMQKEAIWYLYLDDVRVTDILLRVEYADGATEEITIWPNPEESFK